MCCGTMKYQVMPQRLFKDFKYHAINALGHIFAQVTCGGKFYSGRSEFCRIFS